MIFGPKYDGTYVVEFSSSRVRRRRPPTWPHRNRGRIKSFLAQGFHIEYEDEWPRVLDRWLSFRW